jgi:hypothetical protein
MNEGKAGQDRIDDNCMEDNRIKENCAEENRIE